MIRKSGYGLALMLALSVAIPAHAQLGGNAGINLGGTVGGNTAAININAATAAQLHQLGFATNAASNIVAWIQTNGPITTAAQLDAINGVNATLVASLTAQHRLAVDAAGTLLATAQGAAGGLLGGATNAVGGATNAVGGVTGAVGGVTGGLAATANGAGAAAQGAVNVNTATVQQLTAIGIPAVGAQNIVNLVHRRGRITDLAQLNGVAGVNADVLNTLSANGTLVLQ